MNGRTSLVLVLVAALGGCTPPITGPGLPLSIAASRSPGSPINLAAARQRAAWERCRRTWVRGMLCPYDGSPLQAQLEAGAAFKR